MLKLTLHPNSYDWQFVSVAGRTYTDTGTTACHGTPSQPTAGAVSLLRNPVSGRCIKPLGHKVQVELADCVTTGAHDWTYDPATNAVTTANNQCLDAGAANQKRTLNPNGTITGIGGKCLDVFQAASAPGAGSSCSPVTPPERPTRSGSSETYTGSRRRPNRTATAVSSAHPEAAVTPMTFCCQRVADGSAQHRQRSSFHRSGNGRSDCMWSPRP